MADTAFPALYDAAMNSWPALPYSPWQETCDGLHLRTQVVGKIRLAQMPWLNHSWHVTLYVTARGLTTGPMPYGDRTFQIDFDFQDHQLIIRPGDGAERRLPLKAQAIADFYSDVFAALEEMGLRVSIYKVPSELANPIPFDQDRQPRPYDPEAIQRFWHALVTIDQVFQQFRTAFLGKCSPVHFFWGSFDLAVTRFSGRTAPRHKGGIPGLPDAVTREAYSHEVCSAGFWPGAGLGYPAFYCYAYPEPPGFRAAAGLAPQTSYNETFGEFILPYDAVRTAAAPEEVLMTFLQSTYAAAAEAGRWDRASLECSPGVPRIPRRDHIPD